MTSIQKQKANRKRWAKALRSGQYQQVKNRLHTQEGFCCLGVACDLFGGSWDDAGDRFDMLGVSNYLPALVVEALGLETASGDFEVEQVASSLADLNDEGYSFEKIADLIEWGPEGLFQRE